MLVTGDLLIQAGATLTIEPGTVVRFTAGKDDRHEGGEEDAAISERANFPDDPPAIPAHMIVLTVVGTLHAQGTQDAPIVFTSDSAIPAVSDWQAINVEGAKARLTMDYATVEYNYWGVGIHASYPNISITRTTFQHIATCAICPGWDPIVGRLLIAGNTFRDCRHEGVDSHGDQNITVSGNVFEDNVVGVVANDGSTIRIEGNHFGGNERAISLANGGNPTIRGNSIADSRSVGIWFWEESTALVEGNNFIGNGLNIGLGRSSLDVQAANNWWGTTDPHTIRRLIADGADESGLGKVLFDPFALQAFDLPRS